MHKACQGKINEIMSVSKFDKQIEDYSCIGAAGRLGITASSICS